MSMIDLSRTRFIITAWPDNRWPVEIFNWIEFLMKDITPATAEYRDSVKKKHVVCARNTAVKESALGSDPIYEWFVFMDRDIRPNKHTAKFLALEADVKSCQVDQAEKTAWGWPHDFHESIWCTSRMVLERIEPPWFMQQFNADGTEMVGCLCVSFATKVRAAGFSIAHGGWAEHDRDNSWC